MALGDNNKGGKKNYENTHYSRIKFNNREEKLLLGFSYWSGLLKVTISQEKSSFSGGGTEYDEIAYIHLSPVKSKVLSAGISELLDGKEDKLYGVNTGFSETQSVIAFGKDDGKMAVIIAKVDPEGKIQNAVTFHFNNEYHYGLEWTDFKKMECERNFNNNLELEMFKLVLDQFTEAMTGAMSYSVMDMGRFDNSRINTKIDLVMDALNIERKSSNGNPGNSYFNKNGQGAASPENNNRGRSERSSLGDIEDLA